MIHRLVFDPIVSWPIWWGLVTASLLVLGFALWRSWADAQAKGGMLLRGAAFTVLLAALSGPSWQSEDRQPLSDIVLLVVDETASQTLGARAAQTSAMVARVEAAVAAMENTELRIHALKDGPDNSGSLAMTAIASAVAAEPRARIAGVLLISDGRVHDLEMAQSLPAPFHLLLTGESTDWDRRLVVRNAPAFAIIGEEFKLTLMIEDQGAVPASAGNTVDLTIAIDAEPAQSYSVPVGVELDLPVTLPHGGMNVIRFSMDRAAGELTDRNNAQVIQINGVRDRLRVLLVSGEPHAGERVWRNLLKSDASVDLVHFTILRPPEKQDGVPVDELSLIAFPTRELFVEKIDEFDLIVFDRYRMRGILPMSYIDSVVRFIRGGGTVLVSNGPEYGAVDSLYRSPLSEVLPVVPTARVVEAPFRPMLTALGKRHPVTEGLEAYGGGAVDGVPVWGRWFRAIETEQISGETVLEGPDGLPLLVLDRVDAGRVAVLNSDQAWLWARGFEGGGPQLELLRRLAHWMLKEPELEEEALTATVLGNKLTLTRRTIAEVPPGPLVITGPDGQKTHLTMTETSPGRHQILWDAPQQGLYRLEQDDLSRVIGVGPASPKEFEQVIASGDGLAGETLPSPAYVTRLEPGLPSLRQASEGRPLQGRGWIGLTPREAFSVSEIRLNSLLPGWLWAALVMGIMVLAWLYEGRRKARVA